MKKVSMVLLLVVVMVLTMVGCSNTPTASVETAPTEVNDSDKLEFEPKGTYNMVSFGKEFIIYRFDSPNDDIVVYQIPGSVYIVGEDIGKNDTYYAKMLIRNSEFIALSEKYLLFRIDGKKVAVEIKSSVDTGSKLLQKYSFDGLSDEEKNGFVYPISSEEVCK